MTIYNFAPTTALVQSVGPANLLAIISGYMDYIGQAPTNGLPEIISGNSQLLETIRKVNKLNQDYFKAAQQHSSTWFNKIHPLYQELLKDIYEFGASTGFQEFILTLELEKEIEPLEIDHKVSAIQTQLDSFQIAVQKDQNDLAEAVKQELQLLGELTTVAASLQKEIDELNQEIDDDNDKIAKNTIDVLESDAKDGIAAAFDLMGEKFGQAIAKMCSITFNSLKYEVVGIFLSAKSIEKLERIKRLTRELSEIDEAVISLNSSLTVLRTISKQVVRLNGLGDAIADYFQKTRQQAHEVLNGQANVADKATIEVVTKQWQKLAYDLHQSQMLYQPDRIPSIDLMNVTVHKASD